MNIGPCRTLRSLFLVENLDLELATQVPGARWEDFQLRHLNDDSTFRIEDKARQIAWSWLAAAEGIATAILDGESSIYVSINQDEAKEKIRYARQIWQALPASMRPGLRRDNELNLELANGARLLSLPARPPRGKARTNVYLDEFAHVRDDREIYTAALPVISKGGRLRIGSSPLGAGGVFWEIYKQKLRIYPGYQRKSTPWWEAQAFCCNVAQARKQAPALSTAVRVEMFGNDRVKAIYANMPEDDFRQEYECEFVDESVAWITWEEIKAVQDGALACAMVTCHGADIGAALEAPGIVARWMWAQRAEQGYAVGVDIGRKRNTTEIYAVGLSSLDSYPLRLAITLDGCNFDMQADVLGAVLGELPVTAMLIDKTGIGYNLAETMEARFPGKAQGVIFTNPRKAVWAGDSKMLIQQRKTPLPVDRDLAYQIHSIKRTVTASRNLVFDTAANEKHHADKFWAWALALAAARAPVIGPADGVLASAFGYLG